MFAEELASNASRKRADENRARRRQVKSQQQRKQQQQPQQQQQQQQQHEQTQPTVSAIPTSVSSSDICDDPHLTQTTTVPSAASALTSTASLAAPLSSSLSLSATGAANLLIGASTNATSTGVVRAVASHVHVAVSHDTTTTLSAVERAQQQRELRAQVAKQEKSAIRIQSVYRRHTKIHFLKKEYWQNLQSKLRDLHTLRQILHQKTGHENYAPPPATSTALVQQLLFLATTHIVAPTNTSVLRTVQRDGRIEDLLNQLLMHCLLPALNHYPSDPNMNPVLVWSESMQGRYRLRKLIRLVMVASTTACSLSQYQPMIQHGIKFLRKLVTLQCVVGQLVRTTLLLPHRLLESTLSVYPGPSSTLSITKSTGAISNKTITTKDPPFAIMLSDSAVPLNLLAMVRYVLLFAMNDVNNPIPNDAVDKREACFNAAAKETAGQLVLLVWDAIDALPESETETKRYYRSQIVTHLYTVPLLTWKLSTPCMSFLITGILSSAQHATPSLTVPFTRPLESFVELNVEALSTGKLSSILTYDDVSLSQCPATPAQCLLGNLVQLSRLAPSIVPIHDGSQAPNLDRPAIILVLDVMTALIEEIPLVTLTTSRESAVEWMVVHGSQHIPIVLSQAVLDQCRAFLIDSVIRRWFHAAIDVDALQTDTVLAAKEAKDIQQEQALMQEGASSATSLAAREARVDRNRNFWNSSKWAKKLTKSVSTLLSSSSVSNTTGDPTDPPSNKRSGRIVSSGLLLDTSSVSRSLAQSGKLVGTGDGSRQCVAATLTVRSKQEYDPKMLFALSRMLCVVMSRWGGGGYDDIVTRSRSSQIRSSSSPLDHGEHPTQPLMDGKPVLGKATAKAEPCTVALLNTLCFSTALLKASWGLIQSHPTIVAEVYAVLDPNKGETPVRALCIRPSFQGKLAAAKSRQQGSTDGAALLYIFVCLLAHTLIITDDIEIHDMDQPIPLHQIRRCIQVLKKLLYRACCLDDVSSETASNHFGLALISASSRTMRDLYDRSSRRPLCVPKLWIVADLMDREIRRCKSHNQYVELLSHPVLRVCPFLVSFKRRLKLFERIITTNRIDIQGVNDMNPFNPNPLKPGIPIRITRGRILEDGLTTMNHLGKNMRQRLAVHYINEAGAQEMGIDAGGLFKEFWTDLSAVAFNLDYALFKVTDGAGNCLYPNPSSGAAHGSDHITLFEFLGRILGKALYEGITIHPRFAHFFLSFLRGDYNYLHMLPDLSTVDPQLYNNLMFLKTYDGDAAELCLTFTVANDDFGGTREIPLIPGGPDVEVNNANKHRYIGLVAKYYVVDRVREQSEAFTRGLWEVIDRAWLRIFNEPELQVLISGASDGKIDIDDMRANTRYIGGYTSIDMTVNRFWKAVSSLDEKQQAALLRFVTSCERPPPLGFASMNPPFTIQRVGILRDGDKLPTASTCFNILKLPTYSSEKVLRQRLIYAIESGAGFELT